LYIDYEANIDEHIMKFTMTETTDTKARVADEVESNSEPIVMDKVLKKRFHVIRNQYEFLVSWLDITILHGKLLIAYQP